MKPQIKFPFDAKAITEQLGQFKVTQNVATRQINTYMGKKRISEWKPGTKQYQVVDFGKVALEFISQISKVMEVNEYNLSIAGGIQELRLYGKEVMVGTDTYTEMASLISSTNGLRRFGIFAGLYRLICSNGAFVTSGDAIIHSARHYKTNSHILKAMDFDFGQLNKAFEGTQKELQKLVGTKVTLNTLKKNLISENGDNATKFLSFIQKLLVSKTDRLAPEELSAQQFKHLNSVKEIKDIKTITAKKDIELDAYKAFQCYTEIFRAQSADIINKETDKFLFALSA